MHKNDLGNKVLIRYKEITPTRLWSCAFADKCQSGFVVVTFFIEYWTFYPQLMNEVVYPALHGHANLALLYKFLITFLKYIFYKLMFFFTCFPLLQRAVWERVQGLISPM